jgi:DNA polymerase-3 subunit alpha
MSDIVQMPSVAAAIRDFPELGVATRMEGQVRQLGQHASGYVVSPEDLSQLVGYGRVSDGSRVASLDKYQAEAMGLIKLDILGLETLDVIEDVAREVGLTNTDLYRMPHDRVILEKFNEQKVAGIFQMEGQAVRRILPMFKIESIEDIAFVSAVARPGASLTLDPANVVPEEVRHFIYKKRYFVYQEELMAILRFLGFSWEDVTKFRKLVSRKQITELNRLYATKFAEGCESRGIKEHALFWETINRTGAYMFNKSHAVAYAYLSYIMMHLKVNYPGVFLKCYLNHAKKDVNRRDVIREFVREGWGVTIFDPKRSKEGFQTDESRREILGGLLSIKGIGAAKARAVMAGKIDKGCQKAISGAGTAPEHYAPWACLEDLGNRYKIGSLPEGEYIVVARVWDVDEGRCMIEDINGAEKAYFNPRYVDIEEGRLYRLSVSKFKYCKIESARPKD